MNLIKNGSKRIEYLIIIFLDFVKFYKIWAGKLVKFWKIIDQKSEVRYWSTWLGFESRFWNLKILIFLKILQVQNLMKKIWLDEMHLTARENNTKCIVHFSVNFVGG